MPTPAIWFRTICVWGVFYLPHLLWILHILLTLHFVFPDKRRFLNYPLAIDILEQAPIKDSLNIYPVAVLGSELL